MGTDKEEVPDHSGICQLHARFQVLWLVTVRQT